MKDFLKIMIMIKNLILKLKINKMKNRIIKTYLKIIKILIIRKNFLYKIIISKHMKKMI